MGLDTSYMGSWRPMEFMLAMSSHPDYDVEGWGFMADNAGQNKKSNHFYVFFTTSNVLDVPIAYVFPHHLGRRTKSIEGQ